LPKICVVSESSLSRKLVSSPALTVAWRGAINCSTLDISGAAALFLISSPGSVWGSYNLAHKSL
jgi:hypothetical protein